jgi:hypothetical protein
MPYVLNTQKGTTISHPVVGRLPHGVAIPIKEEWKDMLKHINGLTVFDSVKGLNVDTNETKPQKELFGIEIKNPEPEDEKTTEGEIIEI